VKIEKLIEKNKENYEKIAISEGAIFNRLSWLKMFNDKVQIYGIYDKDNNSIGGFHLYKQKRFGLTIYRNPPFTPTIGPFLQIKAENSAAVMNKWKETLFLMANFFENLPYSIISISLNKDIIDTQPFIWRKFKVIPGYTYIIDLDKSSEDISKEMSARRRNNVNKALKDGLIAKYSDNLEIVKSLVLKTFLRQKKKINQYYLNKVLFEFANKDNSFSFISFQNKKPSATTFCVYDKNTAYYLLSGYDSENSHHGAGALAVWEAIKFAKKLGIKYFDFEGSMVPQIEIFFRGFGGQLVPYYRINKAKLPLEILLKFYKRELF
jgi:hypothetical protein